jgi:hypothetical protein
MKRTVIFPVFLIIFSVTRIFPDILPENKKKISYSFEVINTGDFADYVFLAYPVNISAGAPDIVCKQVTAGNPVYLPCKFGGNPKIYALKKELYNPEDYAESTEKKNIDSIFRNNKNLIPSVNISCTGYADKNAAYNSIIESYKIESIAADTMFIIPDKTIYRDKEGKIIEGIKGDVVGTPGGKGFLKILFYSLPLFAVVIIALIIFIRKTRRK